MRLLLVEDDQSFGYVMKAYLEMNDFAVHWAKSGSEALRLISELPFELCILDIMLPDSNGFAIARQINAGYPEMPFIFLTARALKVDKLKGYKLGCDDYITKPIDEELLIAKIQAILKRSGRSEQTSREKTTYQIGRFQFDYRNQQLKYEDQQRHLTEKEGRLLKMFCDHPNRLVRREKALKDIWGKNDLFNRKTMDVFIFKLRQYLEADERVRIKNVHGKGFILEVDET
jgi:DNA-binding response OmpR family regulator